MLHVGLDLSRTRVDVHVMDETGAPVLVTTAAPDSGGLASLASQGPCKVSFVRPDLRLWRPAAGVGTAEPPLCTPPGW